MNQPNQVCPSRFLVCLALLFLSLSGGCASQIGEGSQGLIIATSEAYKSFSGEFENTDYFLRHKPKRIAVLPFQDLERKFYTIDFDEDDPAGIVRRGMYNHISSLPFEDIEMHNVDRQLKNAGLGDVRAVDRLISEDPRKLASILGVDAAVSGEVTHFDRIFVGIYSQVAVGCEVKMWDLKSGKLLWRAKHVSRAHGGGFSLSPIGLAMATVASIWNLRGTELLSQTDNLFREIVSTIDVPPSELAGRTPPPRIDLFAVINGGKPFTLGQKVSFRLIGDPGAAAYVDLGDFYSGVELSPVGPAVKQALRSQVMSAIEKNYAETGHELTPALRAAVEQELDSRQIYEGSYTVEADQEAYRLTAKAFLVNEAGVQATAIDAAHFVDIDSRPPSAPRSVVSQSLDGKVKAGWATNPEKDIAGYEIWTSKTPLSGYTLAGRTEHNELTLEQQPNFERFYFQVRAVDRAQNKGAFSPAVEAVALPVANLYDLPRPGPQLGGVIAGSVLLVAEKNPFSVMSDVTVGSGAVLYLEPGVELRFAPETELRVQSGDMLAYGSAQRPVRFLPQSASSGRGSWKGLTVVGGGRVLLRHAVIDAAQTGIRIAESAPTLHAVRIAGCSQAGLLLDKGAAPSITCSLIEDNEGQGAMVFQGEGLSPKIHHNTFLRNDPFEVQSYTPLEIDLTQNYWGEPSPGADRFLGNVRWQPALAGPPEACIEPK